MIGFDVYSAEYIKAMSRLPFDLRIIVSCNASIFSPSFILVQHTVYIVTLGFCLETFICKSKLCAKINAYQLTHLARIQSGLDRENNQ